MTRFSIDSPANILFPRAFCVLIVATCKIIRIFFVPLILPSPVINSYLAETTLKPVVSLNKNKTIIMAIPNRFQQGMNYSKPRSLAHKRTSGLRNTSLKFGQLALLTRLFTFAINTRYIFTYFYFKNGQTTTPQNSRPHLSMSMFQSARI